MLGRPVGVHHLGVVGAGVLVPQPGGDREVGLDVAGARARRTRGWVSVTARESRETDGYLLGMPSGRLLPARTRRPRGAAAPSAAQWTVARRPGAAHRRVVRRVAGQPRLDAADGVLPLAARGPDPAAASARSWWSRPWTGWRARCRSLLQEEMAPIQWVAIVEFLLAVALVLYVARRARSSLPSTLSEALLGDLKDRLQAQGRVPPLPEGWHSQSAMLASEGVGYAGDFLVADLRDDRQLEVILVDVCGKGVGAGPAALQFSGALGGLIGSMPPEELFRAANAFLLRQHDDESFATAVHLLLDLVDGGYQITSAGHPPALRLDLPSGEWLIDNARGTALGVLADPELHVSHGRLFPGEALLFYTDGVVEARATHIDVGIAWLQRAAREAVGHGFGGAANRIIVQVETRRRRPGGAHPEPDEGRLAGVQLPDHVLDVRLLHGQVRDVVRRHHRGHDRRGRGVGREAQPLARPLDPAHRRPLHGDRRPLVDQVDHQGARGAALLVQPGEGPVVDRGAVVDDDHPPAQRLDVLEVVGGEQQGGAALGVEGAQELAQPALAHHVEADGGLVEVEDLRVVQQRGRDVAAHPLAEAELPHRGVEQVTEGEQLDELGQVGAVPGRVGPVDLLEQVEGVAQRQVPPERGALAEDHADPAGQRDPVAAAARRPPTRIVPPVGTRMPVSILMVVDFPAPFGPM